MTQSKSQIKNSKLFYMYVAPRWYGPEVDLNGYPRISNPYCRDNIGDGVDPGEKNKSIFD